MTDDLAIEIDRADVKARFLYGTAWKENETQRLTELALEIRRGQLAAQRRFALGKRTQRSSRESLMAWLTKAHLRAKHLSSD